MLATALYDFISKYRDFKTRSSRAEFIYSFLFLSLTWIAILLPDFIVDVRLAAEGYNLNPFLPYFSQAIIYALVIVLTAVPFLALSARRLNDVGLSRLYIMMLFTPITAPFILVPLIFWASTQKTN